MLSIAIVSPYIGAGNFEVTVLQILSLKISVLSRILDAEKFALDSEYPPVTKRNWHPNFLMYSRLNITWVKCLGAHISYNQACKPINLGAKWKPLISSFQNCPWIWDLNLNCPALLLPLLSDTIIGSVHFCFCHLDLCFFPNPRMSRVSNCGDIYDALAFGARLTTRPGVGKVMIAITCDTITSGWFYGDSIINLEEGMIPYTT